MPTDLVNFWYGHTLICIVIALGRVYMKLSCIFCKESKIPRLVKILGKK